MSFARRGLHSIITGAAVCVTLAACEGTPIPTETGMTMSAAVPRLATAPLPTIPSPTTYSPASQTPDQVKLCKDAASPAGSYNFTVSASNTLTGDQVASAATLTPGQCMIVFNRVHHSTIGQFANVTVSETVPQAAAYRVKEVRVNDIGGARAVTGTNSVTVQVNGIHGAVVDYVNEPVIVNPPPITASNGQVILCKAGPFDRFAIFDITIVGLGQGDMSVEGASIPSGLCVTIFQRNQTHGSAATLLISERPLSNTTLTSVTVNGSAATVVNRGVTVTQNFGEGKVIVFTNSPSAGQ